MFKNKIFWWILAILWSLLIAYATRSPFFTGDSTEELLKDVFLDSEVLNIFLRKTGHVVAFGILAVIFWFGLRGTRFRYLLAWILATTYGAIDEWHQTFIPARDGVVADVIYNSVGAFLALICVYFVLLFKEKLFNKG